MFKNMKIEITDEAHLKAVCERLESLGYKKRNWQDDICADIVLTTIDGQYMNFELRDSFHKVAVILHDAMRSQEMTDYVSDIRNHLSPHTVVIDL